MVKKIAAAVILLALLIGGGVFAKKEYDKWHIAQPDVLGMRVVQALARRFPEIPFQTDEPVLKEKETGEVTFIASSTAPQAVAEIVMQVKDYNFLKKPLYELKSVRGLVATEVIGAEEASFTVDERGFPSVQYDPELPLFENRFTSTTVRRLFTDLQIIPGEGYKLVKAQDRRLFLTVPEDDDDVDWIREALSESIVRDWHSRNEEIRELEMTTPLLLAEDEAVVFARYAHGAEGEKEKQSESCFYVRGRKNGSWAVRGEQEDQVSLMEYTKEPIYDLPDYELPPPSRAKNHPYYIMVNRQMNTVSIFTKDEKGNFTVPYKAMICSTGRTGHETPTGNFDIMNFKAEWCYMVDGSYGQYATGFLEGGYLFHSICYTAKDRAAMMADEYNALGGFASAGCVRLQVEDAKWIFDNCEVGTGVTVYDSPVAGPMGQPPKKVERITEENNNGWDPTDPDPGNPWLKSN